MSDDSSQSDRGAGSVHPKAAQPKVTHDSTVQAQSIQYPNKPTPHINQVHRITGNPSRDAAESGSVARELEIKNMNLAAEIAELKARFSEEREQIRKQHESVLNTHIQRHQVGIESVKKHYGGQIATLNQEVMEMRQEAKSHKAESEKLKQENALLKLKA